MSLTMTHLHAITLWVLCAVCFPAHAQSISTARIDLNGSIQAGTCTVAAVTRTMPPVSADVFPQVPTQTGTAAASYTDFALALTACSGVTGATFKFGDAADASTQQASVFRNKAANGAPYTAIWLRDSAACTAGGTIAPGGSISRNFTAATYAFPLCAQYVKVAGGLVTMGPLTTTFTVTITYR
jgi:type 1 fimbria pilin